MKKRRVGNARKERVESKREERRELKEHGVKRVDCGTVHTHKCAKKGVSIE